MDDNHIDTTPIKQSSSPNKGAYSLLISGQTETYYYRDICEIEVSRRVGVHFIGMDYSSRYRTQKTIQIKDEIITITIYNDNKFR